MRDSTDRKSQQDQTSIDNAKNKSPFNEASDKKAEEQPTAEEEATAEQQRKEALTERD